MQIGVIAMRTENGDFINTKPLNNDSPLETLKSDKALERLIKELIAERLKKNESKSGN